LRTLLVNPTDSIQRNYSFLSAFEEELLKAFVDLQTRSIVYLPGITYAENNKPHLVPNLKHNLDLQQELNFGRVLSLLVPKKTVCAPNDIMFNANVGLCRPPNKEDKLYAFFIGYSVQINIEQPKTILILSKKKIKNAGFFIKKEGKRKKKKNHKKNHKCWVLVNQQLYWNPSYGLSTLEKIKASSTKRICLRH
jgi:nucleosome binding factor SPN SPT16 subunit